MELFAIITYGINYSVQGFFIDFSSIQIAKIRLYLRFALAIRLICVLFTAFFVDSKWLNQRYLLKKSFNEKLISVWHRFFLK